MTRGLRASVPRYVEASRSSGPHVLGGFRVVMEGHAMFQCNGFVWSFRGAAWLQGLRASGPQRPHGINVFRVFVVWLNFCDVECAARASMSQDLGASGPLRLRI